jgi:hypothetical protein
MEQPLFRKFSSPQPQTLLNPRIPSLSLPAQRAASPAPPRASGPALALAGCAGVSRRPPRLGSAGSRVPSAPCRLSRAREAAPLQTPTGQGRPLRMGQQAERRRGHRPRPARQGGDASRRLSLRRPPGSRRTLHSAARAAGTERVPVWALRAGDQVQARAPPANGGERAVSGDGGLGGRGGGGRDGASGAAL